MTNGFFDCSVLRESLAEGLVSGVPGKAADFGQSDIGGGVAKKETELTDPMKSLAIFIEVSYKGVGNYPGSKHLRIEEVTTTRMRG